MRFDSHVTGGVGVVGSGSGSFGYLTVFFFVEVGIGSFGGTLTDFQFAQSLFFTTRGGLVPGAVGRRSRQSGGGGVKGRIYGGGGVCDDCCFRFFFIGKYQTVGITFRIGGRLVSTQLFFQDWYLRRNGNIGMTVIALYVPMIAVGRLLRRR